MKITGILLNNIWLKLLALFLALITLLYVGETTKTDLEDRTLLQKFFTRSNIVSKKMLIRPVFVGTPPPGYILRKDEIKLNPEAIVVVGPARYISAEQYIFTEPIDLSEHTKNKTIIVGLESISRSVKSQELKVQVYLPIKKTGEKN